MSKFTTSSKLKGKNHPKIKVVNKLKLKKSNLQTRKFFFYSSYIKKNMFEEIEPIFYFFVLFEFSNLNN